MGILIAFKVLQNGNRTETFEDNLCVNMEKQNKRKKRNILNFATWNVQGISYKEGQLDNILAQKSIKIAVTSEIKRKLEGSKETNNYIQIYSGVKATERVHSGVMLIVHIFLKSNIHSYNYWSNRIIQLRLKLSQGYLTIIGIYAPIEGNEDENDCFYKLLQKILDKINKSDMIAIMGDFNPRVGNIKIHNIGPNGENTCNRNGKRLIDFAKYNNMKITNSWFQHKDSHKYTWSARGQRSTTDYIICNKKLSEMGLDTKVY
jgi:exonuclease III